MATWKDYAPAIGTGVGAVKKSSSYRIGLSRIVKKADLANRLATGDIKYETLPPLLQAVLGGDKRKWLWDAWGVPVFHNLFGRSVASGDSKIYSNKEIDDIFGKASKGSLSGIDSRDKAARRSLVLNPPANINPESTQVAATEPPTPPNREQVPTQFDNARQHKQQPTPRLKMVEPESRQQVVVNATLPPKNEQTPEAVNTAPSEEKPAPAPLALAEIPPQPDSRPAPEPSHDYSIIAESPPKYVTKSERSLSKTYRNVKLSPALEHYAYAAGGIGLAAFLYMLLRKNKKKKSRRKVEKRAGFESGWKGWVARRLPEINLLDDAMRATTKRDYKNFNEDLFRVLDNSVTKYEPWRRLPSGDSGFGWSAPFSVPGDKVRPVKDMMPVLNGLNAYAANLADPNNQKTWSHKIKPDMRAAPLALFANCMLPFSDNPEHRYSEYPSIGNLAYAYPQFMGQYAKSLGLSDEEVGRISTNGLDQVVIDAVKANSAEYPALKNLASAYINGGFGDVSDPKGFGMRKPLWDYSANAPTQEGTNMLKKVVSDIGAAGGYAKRTGTGHYNEYYNKFLSLGGDEADRAFYGSFGSDLGRGIGPEKYKNLELNEESKYYKDAVEQLRRDPAKMKILIDHLKLPGDSTPERVAYNAMKGILDIENATIYNYIPKDNLPASLARYRKDYFDARDDIVRNWQSYRNSHMIDPSKSGGYDQNLAGMHYKELLRFFDAVGPSVFMPKTVLGRDAVYHPVGGVIPNIEKGWKRFIPYVTKNKELIRQIDEASGGLLSRAVRKADGAIKKVRQEESHPAQQ